MNDKYEDWKDKVLDDFKTDHPKIAANANRIEISEDGVVFVHWPNTAYPMQFKGYEKWEEDL